MRHAFRGDGLLERREAQRCLANAMFLKPATRNTFIELGGVDDFVQAFEANTLKGDVDDDFLLGRIGFLLSAEKGAVVERLVKSDKILEDVRKVCPIQTPVEISGPGTICCLEQERTGLGYAFLRPGRDIEIHVQPNLSHQSCRR